MSINVTVSGHPINIRHGRVLLSDLDQIKKNERDRRRRLRLEQVRQQSKEISNRLLERAKNASKQELDKLEKDGKSELKRMHERRIMEIYQKYQEDMEDIGQAHASAALQTDANEQIEEESKKNKAMALKRGKEAMQQLREEKKDDPRADQQERIRKVREIENLRSTLIANLPKRSVQEISRKDNSDSSPEEDNEEDTKTCSKKSAKKKKSKRVISKRSPRKIFQHSPRIAKLYSKSQKSVTSRTDKSRQKSPFKTSHAQIQTEALVHQDPDHIEHISTSIIDDHVPRQTVPVSSTTPTKADKVARYNPEDYTQEMSDSSSSSSSTSISDDSSYFSDSAEQQSRSTKTPKHTTSLADSKVQLYDFSTRQRNAYDRPLGIVERHDIRNEPNAIEAAREVQRAESIETQVEENRRRCAQQRGQDAMLRERVRRDYQTLIKNLDHLTSEERKLTASQIHRPEDDIHLRHCQRKRLQEEKEKKTTRAIQALLRNASDSTPCPGPAPKTAHKSAKKDTVQDDIPDGKWEKVFDEQSSVQSDDSKEELSREEQILDMLKKVERQKRLLLREFGASLPDDIFNASMKSLLEIREQPPQSQPCSVIPPCTVEHPKPMSPEINVINMSHDELPKKKAAPVKKTASKKIEAAVQTSVLETRNSAEDKSVQVELIQEKPKTVDVVSKDIDADAAPIRHHPIEPKITIITPAAESSSSESTSSIVTDVIIDINKREVKVTPKKRKRPVNVSKRSSKTFQKSCSIPASKVSSPLKKLSKSLPGSCSASPRKSVQKSGTHSTPKRKVDTGVSKPALNVRVEPTEQRKLSLDASTETSQIYSSFENHDRSVGKPYRMQTQSRRIIRIRDTSDTSTSFASPPPMKAGALLQAMNTDTPILEMLDSSMHESRLYSGEISPVSTPDTPSPRTMMMPSNIPRFDRISKILKFTSTDSQTNDSVQPSSTQNDNSTSTDPSDYNWKSSSVPQKIVPRPGRSLSSAFCSCKNPNCKKLHQLSDIQTSTLKDCPEILKKYEDLQNICAERIASLSDLIEKVRNEQKGMELSVIKSEDDTSFMQLPSSLPRPNDLNDVRRLVENIEAIHNQLAKTLVESQRLIINESNAAHEEPSIKPAATVGQTPRKSADAVTQSVADNNEPPKMRSKPRIISDEKVNIQLSRFKMNHKLQTSAATKVTAHDDSTIEKLSKEILEQTQGFDRISGGSTSLKQLNSSSTRHKGLSPNDSNKSKRSPSPKGGNTGVTTKKEHDDDHRTTKSENYVPILAGIPKVSRPFTNSTSINGRSKPPVTLLSGPSRPDIESPGHELSTIVEFDTPDNVSKCQGNAKSPSARRKSFTTDATSDSQNSMLKKSVESEVPKSSAFVKPSVHIAPLPARAVEQQTSEQSSKSPSTKLQGDSVIPTRTKEIVSKTETDNVTKDVRLASEKIAKESQRDASRQEDALQAKDQLDPSVSTGQNIESKIQKEKITSTSSNSFSGLSGISEITSTPSSDILKYVSSPEEMETALKKFGLGWAITTLKKTREASALSSSSNSDVTPLNTARRIISPTKKQFDGSVRGLPNFSDVSSISIKEASKSTEQAVLLKGRTSTPKMQHSNSNSNGETSNDTTTTSSGTSIQEPSDSLTAPNFSLTKSKASAKQGENV